MSSSSSHEVVVDSEDPASFHYEAQPASSFQGQQEEQQVVEEVVASSSSSSASDSLSAFFFSHRLEQEYGDDAQYFTGANKPVTPEFARLHLLYLYVRRASIGVLALLMLFMLITIILSAVHMHSDVLNLASNVITNSTILSMASSSLAIQSNSSSFSLTSVAITNTVSLIQGLLIVAILHLFLVYTAWRALTKQTRTSYGYFVVSVFISGLILFSVGSAVNSHGSSGTTLVQEGWEATYVLSSSSSWAITSKTKTTTSCTSTNSSSTNSSSTNSSSTNSSSCSSSSSSSSYSSSSSSSSLLVSLESSYSCCGLFSFNDTFAVLPCPTLSSTAAQSCLMPLSSQFMSECHSVGGATIAFGLLELCGFAVLVVLLWQLQNERIKVAQLP